MNKIEITTIGYQLELTRDEVCLLISVLGKVDTWNTTSEEDRLVKKIKDEYYDMED